MSVFPLNIQEKVNSPELLAFFQQFGYDKYLSAEEINVIIAALDELNQSLGNSPSSTSYKGELNLSGPTLINGTGTIGDFYKVVQSGNYDFGAGDIYFSGGDFILYDGSSYDLFVFNNQVDLNKFEPATLPLNNNDILLVNQGGTFKKVAKSDLVAGGGPEYIYETIDWKALRFNSLNTWRAPVHEENFFDTELLGNFGTGIIPADTGGGYPAAWHEIPIGYKVESIDLNVSLRQDVAYASTTNLQVSIRRSEVNFASMASAFTSTTDLVNEVVTLGIGADRPKFIKPLTVADNSSPTLNRGYYRIWARENTSPNCNYKLRFNVIYKRL